MVKNKKEVCECKDSCGILCKCCSSGTGSIYGLGFIGAVIYYISTATGFWMGVLGMSRTIH